MSALFTAGASLTPSPVIATIWPCFLSAFVPTLIAQKLFQPTMIDVEEEEALGEEDLTIIHRAPDA
jgi:hypothetical protein